MRKIIAVLTMIVCARAAAGAYNCTMTYTACTGAYALYNSQCYTSCSAQNSNYWKQGNVCKTSCDSGWLKYNDATYGQICVQTCPSGLAQAGECVGSCTGSLGYIEENGQCIKNLGYRWVTSGGGRFLPCIAGRYCEGLYLSTQYCLPGYYCPAGSTTNKGQPITNAEVATPDPECQNGAICKCKAGNYCPQGSSTSSGQPVETIGSCTSGTACTCAAGYYCPETSTEPTGKPALPFSSAVSGSCGVNGANNINCGCSAGTNCKCPNQTFCGTGQGIPTLCSTLSGVSPAGGVYASVPTADATLATVATQCKYTGPDKTGADVAGCVGQNATSNQVSYTGSWVANIYSYTASPGYTVATGAGASGVAGNYSAAKCSACTGNDWSLGGATTSCTSCIPNYIIATGDNHSAATQCSQTCADGQWIESAVKPATGTDTSKCASVGIAYYSTGARKVYQADASTGRTITRADCPTNYRAGTNATKFAKGQCQAQCTAGQILATAAVADDAPGCATPAKVGVNYWYSLGAHLVAFGSTSAQCTDLTNCAGKNYAYCIANYKTPETTVAVNHDGFAACTQTCAPGKYLADGTAACADAGVEYWAPGGTAAQTAPNIAANAPTSAPRSQCPADYWGGIDANKSLESQCQADCTAGQYVATANAACATPAANNWWSEKHSVLYGQTSMGATTPAPGTAPVHLCLTNYSTPNSTTATDHAGFANCTRTCDPGLCTTTDTANCAAPANGEFAHGGNATQQSATTGQIIMCKSCPANYKNRPAASGAAQNENECQAECITGTIVATEEAACSTPDKVDGNYWYTLVASHFVNFGSKSVPGTDYKNCMTNFRTPAPTGNWTAAADNPDSHESFTNCSRNCPAGEYAGGTTGGVASETGDCVPVGPGYYAAAQSSIQTSGTTATPLMNRAQCGLGNYCPLPRNAAPTNCGPGHYCPTATESSPTDCGAGYYCEGPTDSARTNCGAGHYCPTTTESSPTDCGAGYYCPGPTDSSPKNCGIANYCPTDNESSATACHTGYQGGIDANKSLESQCQADCLDGQYVATANAACTTPAGNNWWSSAHSVFYGQTSMGATALAPDTTPVHSCLTNYATPNTADATAHDNYDDCKRSCAAGLCTTSDTANCAAPANGEFAQGGNATQQSATTGQIIMCESCPANYKDRPAASGAAKNQSECQTQCGAGKIVETANAVCLTPAKHNGNSWFTLAASHLVNYGSISARCTDLSNCGAADFAYCMTNFATPNTADATAHDDSDDCTRSCPAGQYAGGTTGNAATAIGNCVPVGPGYYAAAQSSTQTSTNTALPIMDRTQCTAGQICNGNNSGAPTSCPSASTSDPGNADITNCYIPGGTILFIDANGNSATLETLLGTITAGPNSTAGQCYYNP